MRGSHLSLCTKTSILHLFPQIFNKHLLCADGKETKVSRVSFQVSEAQDASDGRLQYSMGSRSPQGLSHKILILIFNL